MNTYVIILAGIGLAWAIMRFTRSDDDKPGDEDHVSGRVRRWLRYDKGGYRD